MRYVAAALVILLALVAVVLVGKFVQPAPAAPSAVQIHMTSNPFPSSVGVQTLLVALTQADGTPVEAAAVQLSAEMMMPGMLPLNGRAGHYADGQYPFEVTWSMAGDWQVQVQATLADGATVVQDSFNLYVYPVPPRVVGGAAVYHSASEVQTEITANPEHEYWIIIPQGTQQMIRTGQGEDIIPTEIHLSLTGQHILYIRNDDIADHTVGPFFIRAGETIRQEFTRAAEFIGKCTILHGNEVSIVVD